MLFRSMANIKDKQTFTQEIQSLLQDERISHEIRFHIAHNQLCEFTPNIRWSKQKVIYPSKGFFSRKYTDKSETIQKIYDEAKKYSSIVQKAGCYNYGLQHIRNVIKVILNRKLETNNIIMHCFPFDDRSTTEPNQERIVEWKKFRFSESSMLAARQSIKVS